MRNLPGFNEFEKLYDKYCRAVYNYIYARMLSRETAEDLTQETFVSAYSNLASFNERKGSFDKWLFAIAHNLTVDFFKSAYVRRMENLPEIPEKVETKGLYEEGTIKNPINLRTYRILEELTDDERDLLALRYEWGFSNEEIGNLTNSNAPAISQRFHRLLEKCRKLDEEKK